MAEHLASIFGTEKDRVNCPFFFKIGSCRHGDRCSRLHNKPTISQTLLMPNMYQSPATIMTPTGPAVTDPRQLQEHFEDFYEDIFEELDKFGQIENLNVCDNLADHLVGNVYVKFKEEESAGAACKALAGRYYSGRPIVCEFSPVTDFRESTCRQYEENTCNRGGYCNFMHLKPISRDLRRRLFGRYRERSRSRERRRSRSKDRGGDRERRRSRSRERRRSRSRDRGDRRRSRSRSKDRKGRDAGREAVSAKGMTDEERRAMFATWNTKPGGEGGDGGDAGAAAAAPAAEVPASEPAAAEAAPQGDGAAQE